MPATNETRAEAIEWFVGLSNIEKQRLVHKYLSKDRLWYNATGREIEMIWREENNKHLST